jgi:hypothetical protein
MNRLSQLMRQQWVYRANIVKHNGIVSHGLQHFTHVAQIARPSQSLFTQRMCMPVMRSICLCIV